MNSMSKKDIPLQALLKNYFNSQYSSLNIYQYLMEESVAYTYTGLFRHTQGILSLAQT